MALELFPMTAKGDVRADGNCFFRSVAKLLHDDQSLHLKIRAEVCDHVQGHPEEFEGFVEDLAAWTSSMQQDREWADGLAVRACAQLFGPIAVFRSNNADQAPSIFAPNTEPLQERSLMLFDLDEKSKGAEHYSPLLINHVPPVPYSWNHDAETLVDVELPVVNGDADAMEVKNVNEEADNEKVNEEADNEKHGGSGISRTAGGRRA